MVKDHVGFTWLLLEMQMVFTGFCWWYCSIYKLKGHKFSMAFSYYNRCVRRCLLTAEALRHIRTPTETCKKTSAPRKKVTWLLHNPLPSLSPVSVRTLQLLPTVLYLIFIYYYTSTNFKKILIFHLLLRNFYILGIIIKLFYIFLHTRNLSYGF